jgi:hypothetical protein
MAINRLLQWGLFALLLLIVLSGSSLSENVPVNLMIDLDSPASPTPDQVNQAMSSIVALTNEINPKGLNATIYATSDTASSSLRLMLTTLGSKTNYELALNGITNDEKLGSMDASKQETLLKNGKKAIDSCHICGGRTVPTIGFRPQSFDQNNDTIKVLENLGFQYDAGFKAGTLYMSGHKNDAWPYLIEGYNLYAVPVSTYNISGDRVYLSDRFVKEDKGLSGTMWYDLLVGKFNEAAKNGDPMVVTFSNIVSGSGDYFDAYKNFINYAISKNAKFVTTMELVNLTKTRDSEGNLPILAGGSISSGQSGCVECGQQNSESKGSLSIDVTITHKGNCSNCTDSSKNASILI